MASSSAGVQSPPTPTQVDWTTAGLVVLLAAALSVLAIFAGQRLGDGHRVGGATTARTSAGFAPATSLAGTDLGGSVLHRSGNQP